MCRTRKHKVISPFFKVISGHKIKTTIRNHFRNRLGKAAISSTVNDPNVDFWAVGNRRAPRRSSSRNIRLLRGRIREERRVAYAGVRLSTMAKRRIWVTTSLESTNFLLGQKKTSGEELGFLASLPYCLNVQL